MSAMRNTYATSDYATKIRARAAFARKMARRRAIAVTIAGLTFVVGINVLLAIHDNHANIGADKATAQYRRDLDRKAEDQVDAVVIDGKVYTFSLASGR